MYALHPTFVHFPIGLLLLGLLVELYAVFRTSPLANRFGWWLQIAGTVGLLLTVGSGLLAAASASPLGAAKDVFEAHQSWAFATTATYSVLTLWRVARKGALPVSPVVYRLLLLAATLFLVVTAWYGGELVYRFAIGVHPS